MDNGGKLSQGLQALAHSAFPCVCQGCGQKFESMNEFVSITNDNEAASSGSLNQNIDEKGTSYLEITRKCVCGSTLKGEFGDRRDTSEAGIRRRENFTYVLEFLNDKGFSQNDARNELLKLIRGEKSEALAPYLADSPMGKKTG